MPAPLTRTISDGITLHELYEAPESPLMYYLLEHGESMEQMRYVRDLRDEQELGESLRSLRIESVRPQRDKRPFFPWPRQFGNTAGYALQVYEGILRGLFGEPYEPKSVEEMFRETVDRQLGQLATSRLFHDPYISAEEDGTLGTSLSDDSRGNDSDGNDKKTKGT
jgi:hypothetical protein